jgi:serine/threonine-protein kinase
MREQGETIPGYRLLRRFEEGGMGQVWLAEDQRRNRQVAIKTMRPELAASRRMIQMFLRESQISLSLRHPNIVEFLDAGEYHGTLYIVMEYVDGEDAEKLRQREGGRLAENAVVALARQTLEALTHAHGQHIVHRDLKPPNLLVRGRLPSGRVQVTDFGLARNFRAAGMSGLTRRGDVRGSIPFMAPEQVLDCRGVDHRADLYSLGSTMYYLLTGQFIYDFRRGRDPLLTVLEDPVVPLERRGVRVSPPLAGVIHRALCKEVAGRYPSAEAMQQALPTGW